MTFIIIIGFALQNKHEYQGISLQSIQLSFKNIQIMHEKNIHIANDNTFASLLYIFQMVEGPCTLENIFSEFSFQFRHKISDMNQGLSKLLLEL